MDLSAALCIFNQIQPNRLEIDERDRHRTTRSKLCDILSWVALLFNGTGGRSNVAAVLDNSTASSPSIIISTDYSSAPTEVDLKVIERFKKLTYRALTEPGDTSKHSLAFNTLLVQQSWSNIDEEMTKLRDFKPEVDVGGESDTIAHYKGIMTRWLEHEHLKKRHITLTINDCEISPLIRRLKEGVSKEKTPESPEEGRAKYYMEIVKLCKALKRSEFLRACIDDQYRGADVYWRLKLSREDTFFLAHLRHQISLVLMFSEWTDTYLTTGIPYFQELYQSTRTESAFLDGLSFVWTKETRTVSSRWTSSPSNWLSKLTKENGWSDEEVQAKAKLPRTISQCWKPGEAIQGRLHCEVAMLDYIRKHQIKIAYLVIGTAKPMCWVCRKFFETFEADGGIYAYRAEKTEYPSDWLMLSTVGIAEDDLEKASSAYVILKAKNLLSCEIESRLLA